MSKQTKDNSAAIPAPEAAQASQSLLKAQTFPTLEPPTLEAAGAVGTMFNGQKVVQTFGSANDQNQWLNITGAGFKKIINTSSSANMALTIIGNHAKQLNSPINYRTEADGLIHEIYAF